MNIDALKSALSDPALAGLTDDQVAARPGFGAAVLTPKVGIVVTYVTLASVWGAARLAQFKAAMNGAMAQTANPAFAALASAIDTVLQIGIDPANRDVPGVGAQFVAAGLATADEFNSVFFNPTFVAGAAVTAADVGAARAAIAREQQADALRSAATGLAATWVNETLNPAAASDAPLPTLADFKTFVANAQ